MTICVIGTMAKQLDKRTKNDKKELQISAVLIDNNCPDFMENRSNCSNGKITANIIMPFEQNLDVRIKHAHSRNNRIFSLFIFFFLSHLVKLEST